MKVHTMSKSAFNLNAEKPVKDYEFYGEKDKKQGIYLYQMEVSQNAMKNTGFTDGSKDVDKKNSSMLLMQQGEKYDNKLK